jgi:hypothetical protein
MNPETEKKAEARRIAGEVTYSTVLVLFDDAAEMEAFAEAVRVSGVPKNRHKEVAEVLVGKRRCKGFPGRTHARAMSEAVKQWWYVESGQKFKDDAEKRQQAAWRAYERRCGDGNVKSYLLKIGDKIRELTRMAEDTYYVARSYDHQQHRDKLVEYIDKMNVEVGLLRVALTGPAEQSREDKRGRKFGAPGGVVLDNDGGQDHLPVVS